MAVLTTGDVTIPTQILDPWVKSIAEGSTVAALSGAIPMKFGPGQAFIFDIGEAEYVGEGAAKGGSTITSAPQAVAPYKFHKTLRFTDEVLWADEDYQLEILQSSLEQIQPALSRALDFGVFHGINPTGGAAVTAMATSLSDTTNTVEYDSTDAAYVSLDAADAAVLASGAVPADVALDPVYAAKYALLRNSTSGQKMYPDLVLSTQVGSLDGHRSSVSRTVGAVGVSATDTDIIAFVGDFSAIRWGVQRSVGLDVIQTGDPDGGGDLKRYNQIAFRYEIVYGWGIADLSAFAKITDAT